MPPAGHQCQRCALHGRGWYGPLCAWGAQGRGRDSYGSARRGAGKSLEDFAARIDPRLLNRRQLESLAGAGAFDALKPDRPALFAAAETILAHAASAHNQRESGQAGLFGINSAESAPIRLPRDAAWTRAPPMAAEREAVGLFF